MSVDSGPRSVDQQSPESPEIPKNTLPTKPTKSDEMTSRDHDQENAARLGDQAKIADIRKSLGLETVIASTNQVTNYDEALGQFVLGDNPDKMVSQILEQIPQGLTISDNELGDIHQSIRIWLTESAGNAARHISYRQTDDQSIKYNIQISCKILSKDERSYLQISMQDNGIGIKPENLDKIGKERFTTSTEHEKTTGTLHGGGHGRFSVDFKNGTLHPRGWDMSVKNRDDGERGAVSLLTMPLKRISN